MVGLCTRLSAHPRRLRHHFLFSTLIGPSSNSIRSIFIKYFDSSHGFEQRARMLGPAQDLQATISSLTLSQPTGAADDLRCLLKKIMHAKYAESGRVLRINTLGGYSADLHTFSPLPAQKYCSTQYSCLTLSLITPRDHWPRAQTERGTFILKST